MISVLGWYGHNNIGDESYKITFPQLSPTSSFSFSDRVENEDITIVGGGDILHSSFLEKVSSIKSKKFIISASANPRTPWHLLDEFSQIFVRDTFSIKFLKSKGIKAAYMPDLAFLLKPKKTDLLERLAKREGTELYTKKVGIVLNAHLMQREDMLVRESLVFQKVCQDLARVADSVSASFVFFPMSTGMPHDDRISNGIVASKCKFYKKNLFIADRLSVEETLDLVSSLDVVISTRLHASIFSMVSNVPFIDLVHHDKNKNFLETMGLEEFGMSYWEMRESELKTVLDDVLSKPESRTTSVFDAYQEQVTILAGELPNVRLC